MITGATGFLGRNILFRLLEKDRKSRFSLIIRGLKDQSPRMRLHSILSSRYDEDQVRAYEKRIDLILGDVTWKHFGLDDRAYSRLADNMVRVIHAAASVSFNLPLNMARNINVSGTENLLDFAALAHKSGSLQRVDYLGTAYVAGKRKGIVKEDELDVGQKFNNTYEQTKFEAEKLIRERWEDLPVAIFRPSIIVGESSSGRTSSFNVMYFPLKIYIRGIWRWIPGSPDIPLDIVPVDFVCDALECIANDPGTIGSCFHLSASRNATTMGQVLSMAASYFGAKPIRFIHPAIYMNTIHPMACFLTFGRLHDMLINKAALYLPYFMNHLEFDNTHTMDVLQKMGLEAPRAEEYFARIFQFCIDTDWGKNLIEKDDRS